MLTLVRRACLSAALVMLAATSGCATEADDGDSGDPASQSADAILGGGVERGWPAVGMLRFASGNFGSGALVTPTVILTAAHVASGNPTQFFYGNAAEGKDPRPENLKAADVAEILIHPCYKAPRPADCPKDAIDIALVRLKAPITDVEPLRVIEWPLEYFWGLLSPYEGESCTAVGFGAHLLPGDKAVFGTRRSARSTVDAVNETELETVRGTGIATSGDSGGPLVCGNRIIGTVRGAAVKAPGHAYNRTREGYERTDLWRGWIRTEIANWSRATTRTAAKR